MISSVTGQVRQLRKNSLFVRSIGFKDATDVISHALSSTLTSTLLVRFLMRSSINCERPRQPAVADRPLAEGDCTRSLARSSDHPFNGTIISGRMTAGLTPCTDPRFSLGRNGRSQNLFRHSHDADSWLNQLYRPTSCLQGPSSQGATEPGMPSQTSHLILRRIRSKIRAIARGRASRSGSGRAPRNSTSCSGRKACNPTAGAITNSASSQDGTTRSSKASRRPRCGIKRHLALRSIVGLSV